MSVAAPVEITLDGAKVSLPYTLDAAKKVNAHFGDFVTAYRRVTAMDFEAFSRVVAAALGKEIKDVEQHVFDTGLEALVKPLLDYLQRLGNGGREIVPVKLDAPGNV